MEPQTIKTIEEHPFLQQLGPEQLQKLSGCSREVRYDAGAFIFRAGDPADTLYLLQEGRVVLEQYIPGQGPAQLEDLRGGDILGLSWFFLPYRWHLDARAVEPVRATAFDAACVREKMETDPVLGYALSTRLLQQIYTRLERVRLQRLDVYKTAS